MIVVLDTNVWVSALEFGGTPDRALYRALTVDQLAISAFIRDEIVRVLTRKFGRNALELNATLDELLRNAMMVPLTGEITGVSRDRDDDAILETAWRAQADALVAGDKDLLAIGSFRGIRIITSAEYAGKDGIDPY